MTLMRAVEDLLAANPALALRSTVVRVHANVLGEEAEQGRLSAAVQADEPVSTRPDRKVKRVEH